MRRPRRNHSPIFKAKVSLAALKGDERSRRWRRDSTSTRIRSRSGNSSSSLHSAIRFVTPDDRHAGRDVALLIARRAVYTRARRRTPARWRGTIRNWDPINAVRLNPEHDDVAIPARVA
jgi:hypothetical protein